MIKAEHIFLQAGKKTLLQDITATFYPGKLNLVIGPNGAGKSTLIKVLSGQIRPDKGSVRFREDDIRTCNPVQLAQMRAVLSQHLEFSFPLKVWEVVMMGRYPHYIGKPQQADQDACHAAMDFFEIDNLKERDYATLSGGEKQRVQFAKVMAQIWFKREDGRYLFLDEPLTFLDIRYQYRFMELLMHLLEDQALTIVGIVHDLNLAARFADHLVVLDKGQIVGAGEPESVLTTNLIQTVYGLEHDVIVHNGKFHLLF